MSVHGLCRLVFQRFKSRADFPAQTIESAVVGEFFGGGIDDHQSAGPVHQQRVARRDAAADVMQGDHRRDPHRTCHDRRVGGWASHVRGETEYLLAVDRRGFRGRQVLRDDNDRLLQRGKADRAASGQVAQDAPGDVAQIRGAAFQVVVSCFGKHGHVVLDHRV